MEMFSVISPLIYGALGGALLGALTAGDRVLQFAVAGAVGMTLGTMAGQILWPDNPSLFHFLGGALFGLGIGALSRRLPLTIFLGLSGGLLGFASRLLYEAFAWDLELPTLGIYLGAALFGGGMAYLLARRGQAEHE